MFIELSRISKNYDGVCALADVDFDIAAGEIHCLVGENGSGKSTLIKIIAGVERPEPGGAIHIDEKTFRSLKPTESRRLGVQVIYQDLSLFPNLTVAENIAIKLNMGAAGLVRRTESFAVAQRAMERVGIAIDPRALVAALSIAQRQLVAICRAIVADARLIIMDEPTASLTRVEVKALLALARELAKKGIAILFVSHKLDEVLQIAERVTVLRDGRKVATLPAREMDGKRLASLITGKAFEYGFENPPADDAPVVLSVRGLRKANEYEDISFDLRAGEILGVIGLLGAGRTELSLSLFGLSRPDAGAIAINGKPAAILSNRQAIELGVAYVPEDRIKFGLVMEQPISINIVITILHALTRAFGLLSTGAVSEAARHWIKELGIKAPKSNNAAKTLSGGNQQRVVIAKWLATNPRVLILDNPTVGVDINAKDGIYAIMRRLAAAGMAIIMISDEIPEVLHHCHRIVAMRKGQLVDDFVARETSEQALEDSIDA